MGYKDFQNLEGANGEQPRLSLDGQTERLELPDSSYITDAQLSREGMDLVLDGQAGAIVIEGYFAQAQQPVLHANGGYTLSPTLVHSFVKSGADYASTQTASDESPVGAVHEITGKATVTHPDGSSETIQRGTAIYQGDIIETAGDGALNIMFIDESSFAVSEDARLAIDEFVFDPASTEGVTNFSVLKGVFVYTSGLIGREDPDDVHIETPAGSIGIRGTIIAGDVTGGQITVIEGAIVLKDGFGNEVTLANAYETARFNPSGGTIDALGILPADDLAHRFSALSTVSGALFSSIQDSAAQQQPQQSGQDGQPTQEQNLDANADGAVDGTVDADGDGAVDGSIDAAPQEGESPADENAAPDADGEDHSEAAPAAQDDQTGDTQSAETTAEPSTLEMAATGLEGSNGGLTSATHTSTAWSAGAGTGAAHIGGIAIGATVLSQAVAASVATTTAIPTNATLATVTETGAPPKVLAQTPPIATTPTDNSGTGNPGTGGGTTTPPATPFTVSATAYTVAENALGAHIGTLSGADLDVNSVVLSGLYAPYLRTVVNTSTPGTVDVYLNSNYFLNYEESPMAGIGYSAANINGTESQSGVFNVNITNMNDPAQYDPQYGGSDFIAGSGQTWQHDFSLSAHDEDGTTPVIDIRILQGSTLIFDSMDGVTDFTALQTSFGIENITLDAQGVLSITHYTLSTNHEFTIDVYLDGNYEHPHSYQSIANNYTDWEIDNGVFYVTQTPVSGAIISGNGGTFSLSGGTDQLEIDGDGVRMNTGAGNDYITLDLATNTQLSTGTGNDTIRIYGYNNRVYAGDGDDIISLEFRTGQPDILEGLTTPGTTSATAQYSGGYDNAFLNKGATAINGVAAGHYNGAGDSLKIASGQYSGNAAFGDLIDFTAIDDSIIRDIEIIDVNNNDNNHIILNATDVIEMTDRKNTLVIRGDNQDSIAFDTQGHTFVQTGTITDDGTGDVYNMFESDIGMTLLIDTDITNVTFDGAPV